MLTFPDPKLSLRTTSPIFGGPIHAAVGKRQQQPDHYLEVLPIPLLMDGRTGLPFLLL
jgi:hypothetical protein